MNRQEIELKVTVLKQLAVKIASAKAVLNVSAKAYDELHDEIVLASRALPEGETVLFPKRNPLLEISSRETRILDRTRAIKLIKANSTLTDLISFSIVKKDVPEFTKHNVKLGSKYSTPKITKIL